MRSDKDRLNALEKLLGGGGGPDGVILIPATTPPHLWALSLSWQQPFTQEGAAGLLPCATCHYPRDPQALCENCRLSPREATPLPEFDWPTSGVVRIPFAWSEGKFLFTVQRLWCEMHGTDHACPRCYYPLAKVQAGCLICLFDAYYPSV